MGFIDGCFIVTSGLGQSFYDHLIAECRCLGTSQRTMLHLRYTSCFMALITISQRIDTGWSNHPYWLRYLLSLYIGSRILSFSGTGSSQQLYSAEVCLAISVLMLPTTFFIIHSKHMSTVTMRRTNS
jgi:hypothetical protein